jgi:hypothetical protein
VTTSLELDDGQMLTIGVRTSKRARRLHLVAGIGGVEAVVPLSYSEQTLSEFISSKRNWLLKTSRYYSRLRERCGGHDPDTIFFLGSRFRFNVVKDRLPSTIVSQDLKVITFHVVDSRRLRLHKLEWYRQHTSQIISERLPVLAEKLGLRYNKVSVKNQKSRWGSCSKKGNLNFNLLLAAAPPEVVDYVIIHELIHLREMDHSRKFWELVSNADPDYRRHRKWLSDYARVIKVG